MTVQSQPSGELLLETDEEFHQLAAQHHELEDRLNQLTAKPYLSEPEQLEEVTLKKRKLQLKDRMEGILKRHRQGQAAQAAQTAQATSMSSVHAGTDTRPHVRS